MKITGPKLQPLPAGLDLPAATLAINDRLRRIEDLLAAPAGPSPPSPTSGGGGPAPPAPGDTRVTHGGVDVPGASETTAEDKGDHLSLKMFGAVGDGMVDDTGAAQRWAAFANTSNFLNGRVLRAPVGKYKITDTITIKNITGAGITGSGTGTQFIWAGPADRPMFDLQNVAESVFEKFMIQVAAGSHLLEGVRVQKTTGATVAWRHNHFRNLWIDGAGVSPAGVAGGGQLDIGIRGMVGTGGDSDGDFVLFTNVRQSHYLQSAVTIEGTQMQGWRFENCWFVGMGNSTNKLGRFAVSGGSTVVTTLAAAVVSTVTTSITVTSGASVGNGQFIIVMAGGANTTEAMLVTAGQGTPNLTVVRGQLGTVASLHASAAPVQMDHGTPTPFFWRGGFFGWHSEADFFCATPSGEGESYGIIDGNSEGSDRFLLVNTGLNGNNTRFIVDNLRWTDGQLNADGIVMKLYGCGPFLFRNCQWGSETQHFFFGSSNPICMQWGYLPGGDAPYMAFQGCTFYSSLTTFAQIFRTGSGGIPPTHAHGCVSQQDTTHFTCLDVADLNGINSLIFSINYIEKMRLALNGFFGIGTPTPLAPAHVALPSSTISEALRLQSSTDSAEGNAVRLSFAHQPTIDHAQRLTAAIDALAASVATSFGGQLGMATTYRADGAHLPRYRMFITDGGEVLVGATGAFGLTGCNTAGDGATPLQIAGNAKVSAAGNTATDVVTTQAAQTLANKDLSSGTNILPAISGAAGGQLTGTYPNPGLISTGAAGTYTRVTTDAQGRVTSGGALSAGDIPDISATYPALVSSLFQTGRTTSLGATNLQKSGAVLVAGMYEVKGYVSITPSGAVSVSIVFGWTDERGIAATTGLTYSGSVAGTIAYPTFSIRTNGATNLTVTVTVTGTVTYDVSVAVVRLL